jgi:hypothetical protein
MPPCRAPVAGKQAPGFYRYKVGDIEVTSSPTVCAASSSRHLITNRRPRSPSALAAAHYDREIFDDTVHSRSSLNTAASSSDRHRTGEANFNARRDGRAVHTTI